MTLAEKFEEFHNENPHVYRALVKLARRWVRQTGTRKLAIKTLYERARWEIVITTNDADFKMNNSYTAFYARLIMAQERDLRRIFDLRASEADEWMAKRSAAKAA